MKKIRNKITLPITVLLICLTFLLILFVNNIIKEMHLDVIRHEMNEKIEFINIIINETPGLFTGKINNRFSKKLKNISEIISMRITIVDHDGAVIADTEHDPATMDNHRYRIEIKDSIEKKSGESIRYSNTLNVDMLYLAKNMDNYIIRLAEPLYAVKTALKKVTSIIFFAGLILIIAAIGIVFFITGIITNPIRETGNFALSFSGGDYSKRILNFSNDEIGILQKTLNGMADRIVKEMDMLLMEQNKLRVTFESIGDGIAVIDNNKNIVIANKTFSSLLDIRVQVVNKIYYEVIRGSSFNKHIDISLSRGESAIFQENLSSGKICEINIIPIKDEADIDGILVVIHDITEKKKIDQLKTDLVGNLSHELKTPIAIVKGYLETIQADLKDDEANAGFIEKAIVNLERQDSIINDMLKLNMLETMTEIQIEPVNLKQIIFNCVEILNSKVELKKIKIIQETDLLDRSIDANRFLAEEIFFNIIINAVNYTNPEGKINILADESKGKVKISIADSGIGIPQDSIDRIFERFYRVDKSRSRSTGGTGLGLSIVKHAAEILGWKISVESRDKGTTFYIEI
jgi:two-component system, OmpR family, phosphate regulon sensor histidine kinase PhoR